MTSFSLKVIALVTMTIDHVGAVFFPEVLFLRIIGRISFPIYAFLISEGYRHTSNPNNYLARMGIFAVISEIPFDLAFKSTPINVELFNWDSQNVFFTLFFGLLGIHLFERFKEKNMTFVAVISAILGLILADLFRSDYKLMGVLLIYSFYFSTRYNRLKLVAPAFAIVLMSALPPVSYSQELIESAIYNYPFTINIYNPMDNIQIMALVALALIYFYNGLPGYKKHKYIFYAFYPAHLSLLFLIERII